jgi:glycerol-3-phosphate dehydrogenase
MKTNLKNIAAVSAIVFAGVFNATASENNAGLFGTSGNSIIDYRKEAQLVTREIADREEAKATKKIFEEGFMLPATESYTESEFAIADLRLEAQLITKEIADRAEAKATQKVMENGWIESDSTENFEESDFRTEAQLAIQLVADKEEVKALQRLISEGKIAENK